MESQIIYAMHLDQISSCIENDERFHLLLKHLRSIRRAYYYTFINAFDACYECPCCLVLLLFVTGNRNEMFT